MAWRSASTTLSRTSLSCLIRRSSPEPATAYLAFENRSWAKDSHIPALRSFENVKLAAVVTTSRASADAAAVAFGVGAAYDDPLALITASDIDIVSVCVRVPHHRDLVLAALAAEKHVYCEWPLGRDRAEAAEMAAAARARAVHVAIGLLAHMNPVEPTGGTGDLGAVDTVGPLADAPLTARNSSTTRPPNANH
jgi:hypothetical protein